MRNLPRNISAHPDGYLVRVQRRGISYQAFVAHSFCARLCHFHDQPQPRNEDGRAAAGAAHTTALLEAVRLRDRFLAIHGAITGRGPSTKAYSNTGLVGISETIHWRRSQPLDCFLVSAAPNFRRRIYFGHQRPRAVALKMAVQLRTAKAGRASLSQRAAGDGETQTGALG